MSEDPDSRHDRTTSHPVEGRRNSLRPWWRARGFARVTLNVVVIVLARYLPFLGVKNWLFRRLGMDVGEGVAWAFEATPDLLWPEKITVGDHAIVGYDATVLCHEFLQDEYRTGEVVIGERAMIGAGAVVLPGVEIGANARVAANSLVVEDVPEGATVAGVPAEVVSRRGTELDDARDPSTVSGARPESPE